MKLCSIEGCGRQNMARRLCRMHYMRAMRAGDLPPAIRWPSLHERLHRHYLKGPVDQCWEWKGATAKDGYGHIGDGPRVLLAHRVMWEFANGTKIPERMVVMHTCDNAPCVNPSHLKLGTFAENILDRVHKNRSARMKGEKHPGSKITEADVRHIRGSSLRYPKLAELYGVSKGTIYEIRARRSWKHID